MRVYGSEVLLCNPRLGGCLVISDAKEFLDELFSFPISEVITHLSKKYNVPVEEISKDIDTLVSQLYSAGVVGNDNDEILNATSDEDGAGNDDKRERNEKWGVGEFFMRHGLAPEIHIDLTDACDEKCVHCYVPSGNINFLPTEIVLKVLTEFRRQQGLTVVLSGGECMLHPDFLEICQECKSLELNLVILSNLTLCTSHVIEVLRNVRPQYVNVSLYSMRANVHDSITRLPGSFERTFSAIRKCICEGIHIRIQAPVLRQNAATILEVAKFAEENQIHFISECYIVPRNNHDRCNQEYACELSVLKKLMSENRGVWRRYLRANKCIQRDDRICDIGERLYLNARGEYYACDAANELIVGNASEMTVEEVYRGEELLKLRNLRNCDFSECVDCPTRAYCKVCPAYNYNATGNIFGRDSSKCEYSRIFKMISEED